MGVAGDSAPSSTHQNLTIFKFQTGGILVVFTGWHPVFAYHQRNLGYHKLIYLGDHISVTFDTNDHQSPNLKIS